MQRKYWFKFEWPTSMYTISSGMVDHVLWLQIRDVSPATEADVFRGDLATYVYGPPARKISYTILLEIQNSLRSSYACRAYLTGGLLLCCITIQVGYSFTILDLSLHQNYKLLTLQWWNMSTYMAINVFMYLIILLLCCITIQVGFSFTILALSLHQN